MNCRTGDCRQKNAECTVRAEGRRQEDSMQQASRQVPFRALGPNVQRSVLAIVVQLGEAPQMLHTLVVVAVVVVVGIKLQMNSRHVISCLTASLQLSAMGHLLPGLAWLWLGLASIFFWCNSITRRQREGAATHFMANDWAS